MGLVKVSVGACIKILNVGMPLRCKTKSLTSYWREMKRDWEKISCRFSDSGHSVRLVCQLPPPHPKRKDSPCKSEICYMHMPLAVCLSKFFVFQLGDACVLESSNSFCRLLTRPRGRRIPCPFSTDFYKHSISLLKKKKEKKESPTSH